MAATNEQSISPHNTTGDPNNNTLNTFFGRRFVLNWEVAAYVVILLLAIFTRFYILGDRVMSHDESLHTVFSHNLYRDGNYRHDPMMHGPILFHATALSYALFGVDDFSSRIYPALLGVLMVMFPVLLRHWLGRTGAILAAVMILLSPLLLYYNRYIRHDTPSILAAMIMFYAAMMYLSGPQHQRRRAHWLYLLAAAMLWNLGSKETAFIYIAVFGAFLSIYWIVRMIQHAYNIRGKLVFDIVMMGTTLGVVMALAMILVFSIALGSIPGLNERVAFLGDQFGYLVTGQPISPDFSTFLSWTGLTFVSMLSFILFPVLWVYRRGQFRFSMVDALVTVLGFLLFLLLSTLMSTTDFRQIDGSTTSISIASVGMAVGITAMLSLWLVYAAFRIEGLRIFRRTFFTILIVMLVVCAGVLIFEELSHVPETGERIAQPVPGESPEEVHIATAFTVLPLIFIWVVAIIVIGGIAFTKRRGWWKFFDHFPEFDVLMVMGSLILPWLTAVFTYSTRADPTDFVEIGESVGVLGNLLPLATPDAIGQFVIGFLGWLPMMAIAVAAGLAWNWRRWLVAFAVFHILFAFFFTTIFTNIQGLASGMVYSLQYWLEQQGVRRGGQPQYYYLAIIMPLYEYLPIIGSMLAMTAGSVVFWRRRRAFDEESLALSAPMETAGSDPDAVVVDNIASEDVPIEQVEALVQQHRKVKTSHWRLTEVPFLWFASWWAVFNLLAYTLAGEKMPWLGTHLAVPMIFLSAWYFGRVVSRINPRVFVARGWLYLFLVPLFIIALMQMILPYVNGQTPFQGTTQNQLQQSYSWLAVSLVALAVGYVIYRMADRTGWRVVRQLATLVIFVMLGMLTFRTSWASSFINYDLATEFLVYAHGGPGNKEVTDELRGILTRINGGLEGRVIYDNKFSWPGSWYMRDFDDALFVGSNPPTLQQLDDAVAVIIGGENRSKFEPLLEDQFQRFDSVRMWWPVQDYFGLTAQRVNDLLNSSDGAATARRQGIMDIWWSRDFTQYENAVNLGVENERLRRSFSLTRWPVMESLHFYVRKDVAAMIWPYGIGDAQVLNPFTEMEPNLCTANWQEIAANLVISSPAQPLIRPLGMSFSADGDLLVADEGTHRIRVFGSDGNALNSFGQQGTAGQDGAFFERPHSVAVDAEGNIFVVDTWNYRIRAFTANYSYITGWGQPVTQGFDVQTQPFDGFWGPRDIAVDPSGRVYVADTGNKRIRVYEADGTFVRDIGSGGSGEGQLNEPAGIVIHPDGMLYVADTWNRRVTVFTLDGAFMFSFNVRGWYEELGNRPYLAIDSERDLLYVTDPDAGRVLVYDTVGNCVGSFGRYNDANPDASQFTTVGDVAVAPDGQVYVSDLGSGRVLRFDPFEVPPQILEEEAPVFIPPEEVMDELQGELTSEITPDVDAPEDDTIVSDNDTSVGSSPPAESPEETSEVSPVDEESAEG